MWIILLYLCVSVIVRNNAQEISTFDAQTDVETSYTKSGVEEDSVRHPITLSIRSGRNENKDRSNAQNSEFAEYYSHDWENLRLVPSELNSNRENYANGNERSLVQELPILFRRPDSETNNTLQVIRSNEFSSIPVPIVYFQTNTNITSDSLTSTGDEENSPNENLYRNQENIPIFDFYRNSQSFMPQRVTFYNPSQYSLDLNVQNFKSDVDEKQASSSGDQTYRETVLNDSTPTNPENLEAFDLYRNYQTVSPPRVAFYNPSQFGLNSNADNFKSNVEPTQIAVDKSTNPDSITARTNEEFIKPLPTENLRTEHIIPTPIDIYRGQRFLPQMVPAYFPPYPFHPYQVGNTFQPVLPYLPNGQTFDRESGPDVRLRIPEVPEKQILPQDASDDLNENLPSETTVNNIPPTLPYPARGYPFGLYPPPFVSPMIPSIPQSGIPPNFYLQARNVPKENINADASLPPLVPIRPVPDIAPVVPPQISDLTPETGVGVIEAPEVIPEDVTSIEEQTQTKIPYAFGFDMNDGNGNDQHRKEVSDVAGKVTGSYAIRDNNGIYRIVEYAADENGFRAIIHSNEPGVASSGSANVVVVAERPPPINEERRETEIIAVPPPNSDLIAAGSIPE